MRVGYCVTSRNHALASYRLRVALPAPHIGLEYGIGVTGNVTFFFKNGHPALAKHLPLVVYDVVNDHFHGKHAADYHAMCQIAHEITCASPVMAEIVKAQTGRDATVIPDPYENPQSVPAVVGDQVVWFGHQANFASLQPYADLDPWVLTGNDWSLEKEAQALQLAAVVFLTGNNPGASANRAVKAIRAGRFVVCPEDSPASWKELSDFLWVGDVRKGIAWALNNREEACSKIAAGQKYVRDKFSPETVGRQWGSLFGSTLERGTRRKPAGSQ